MKCKIKTKKIKKLVVEFDDEDACLLAALLGYLPPEDIHDLLRENSHPGEDMTKVDNMLDELYEFFEGEPRNKEV